eukprot:5160725-Heterocapsa_arctica.AAC.1
MDSRSLSPGKQQILNNYTVTSPLPHRYLTVTSTATSPLPLRYLTVTSPLWAGQVVTENNNNNKTNKNNETNYKTKQTTKHTKTH